MRLPFTLALTCGLRRQEIIGLTWEDINLETGAVHVERAVTRIKGGQAVKVPKTPGAIRTVYAIPAVVELLKAWAVDTESRRQGKHAKPDELNFIFRWPDGRWWHVDYLTGAWHDFCIRHKLPAVNFHGTRHSFASALLMQGTSPVEVSKVLGHASPSTTMSIYAHVMTDAAQRARETISQLAKLPISAQENAQPCANIPENEPET